jgi:hypothetical protein
MRGFSCTPGSRTSIEHKETLANTNEVKERFGVDPSSLTNRWTLVSAEAEDAPAQAREAGSGEPLRQIGHGGGRWLE